MVQNWQKSAKMTKNFEKSTFFRNLSFQSRSFFLAGNGLEWTNTSRKVKQKIVFQKKLSKNRHLWLKLGVFGQKWPFCDKNGFFCGWPLYHIVWYNSMKLGPFIHIYVVNMRTKFFWSRSNHLGVIAVWNLKSAISLEPDVVERIHFNQNDQNRKIIWSPAKNLEIFLLLFSTF